MKINSYILVFIGLLAVELIKNADAATAAEKNLCVILGDAAYQVAVLRDDGDSKFETRNKIYRNFDPSVQEAMLSLVDLVYKRPWYEPAQEANKFVGQCIKEMEQMERESW